MRLDRQTIVDSAVGIVDRQGIDALSFRRLADVLQVTPMAIYRHVRDKDELLELVRDAVLARLEPAERTGDARADVIGMYTALRALLRDHPGVAELFVSRPVVTPAGARLTEVAVAVLSDAGVAPELLITSHYIFLRYTVGAVMWDNARSGGERARLLGAADGAPSPRLLALAPQLGTEDAEAEFRLGADALLDGLLARGAG